MASWCRGGILTQLLSSFLFFFTSLLQRVIASTGKTYARIVAAYVLRMRFPHVSWVRLGFCQRREHFPCRDLGQPGWCDSRLPTPYTLPLVVGFRDVGEVCQLVRRDVGFCDAAHVRVPCELKVGLGSFEGPTWGHGVTSHEFTVSSSHGVMT